MLEADEGDDGLAQAGEEQGTEKGAGHGAGEGEVIIRVQEALVNILGWGPVDEDIVGCLQVERLLDLCVGRREEVEQGGQDEETSE